MAADEDLYHSAKEEFGDQFSVVFSYVKKGERVVKTKPVDIAKQYRKLKGMADTGDDDV